MNHSLLEYKQSLKNFAVFFGKQFQEKRILQNASALSYGSLLALLPLLAISFAIFNFLGGMNELLEKVEPIILSIFSIRESDGLMEKFRSMITHIHSGALGGIGIIGLLFTCMPILYTAENTIHEIWEEKQKRNLFVRFCLYWTFISLGPLALAVFLAFVTLYGSEMTSFIPKWISSFLFPVTIFFFLFKFIPHTKQKSKNLWISALVTAVFWTLAKSGYVLYVKKFVNYDKIYGSLSVIPVLMVWIYLMWIIFLSGVLFSHVRHQTEKKS